MEKPLAGSTVKRIFDLTKQIPLDTLGRVVDAVQGKGQPHPLLLPCSDIEQYESLAVLVEILAGLPSKTRREIIEQAYTLAKLRHTHEKL